MSISHSTLSAADQCLSLDSSHSNSATSTAKNAKSGLGISKLAQAITLTALAFGSTQTLNAQTATFCDSASVQAVPGRIQAESFCEMSGVQTEGTSDSGGGSNVGWLDDGDWMVYKVNIAQSGDYQVAYRIASTSDRAQLQLENQGGSPVYGIQNVPLTGGWQNWQTVTQTVSLSAGEQTIAIGVSTGGFNINWFELTSTDPTPTPEPTQNPTPTPQPTATPQPTPTPTPGSSVTIQAESFAAMSGIQTEPTSDTGGGQNVGWFDVGDWLSYSAVNLGCSGTYTVEYRVAANGAGGSFTLEQAGGGASYGSLNVPNTGGWQNWTNISHDLVLPGGSQSFGIAISQGGWNLNWFKVTEKDCNGNPTPTPTSTPNPGDDITANQAAQAMGKGFNLGQMFESDDKPRTLAAAKAKIDAYYALGFRNVRIPVSWTINIGGSTLANSDGAVDRNHSRVQTIQQVVDYALSLPNLYVIINTHHEGPIKDGNQWWRLERIWADLADIFRDRDHRLLFELLNEPHLGDGSAMPAGNLRNMSGKAYNKIREVDSKRIILIGGNQWFHANEMAEVWPNLNEVGHGQDQYVMATFHHYAPWFEFHSEDAWPKDLNFNDGTVSDPMETMKQWANTVGNGMPVHIGEWGVGWGKLRGSMTCNNIRLWYQKFGPFSAERNQPTSVWDDGGWFKIFDHGTNSFNNNLAQCVSGNCDWNTAERMNSGCF